MHERTPEVCAKSGRIIASWVRLDNRAELCGVLGLDDHAALTDPQIILAAHERWPDDCARHLEGDFSFVIHDPANGATYCARDAIGAKPLFYSQPDDRFILGTSPAAIRAVQEGVPRYNREWIALFLAGLCFADDQTAFEDIAKLRPGHELLIAPHGGLTLRRFHDFELEAPHASKRDPKWVELYREAFHRAIDDRTRTQYLIGAESSGGLDSASIVAHLVRVLPHGLEDFQTFALVAHQREHDLLDELAAQCGIVHTRRSVRHESLRMDELVERARIAIGHPPEHGQPLLSAGFFEHCEQQGIRTVMSGFGGDEIVTGYANSLHDELFDRRDYPALLGEMEGHLPMRLARLAKWRMKGLPAVDVKMRQAAKARIAQTFLSRGYLQDTGLQQRIEDWMAPHLPDVTINQIAAMSPGFRQGRTARLDSSALFAATYGIEYRFPMFDCRLIQFFFSVPSIEKRSKSLGRYLHRRAVAGSIPDSIAWQPGKDLGPPLEGDFAIADLPVIAYGDLPVILQEMIDRTAFEALFEDGSALTDQNSPNFLLRRYMLWHLQQLLAWMA